MQVVDLVGAAATQQHVELSETQVAMLVRYVELVFKWNRIANLTGARTPAEFVNQHVADCLTVLPYLRGRTLADLGSGAGLPGIVIACARPDLEVFLIEPRGKRARFLEQAKIELGLARVTIVAVRIADWQPPAAVDCVVCRAYGSLRTFIDDTVAVQAAACRLIAMKGQLPHAELTALEPLRYALEVVEVHQPAWISRHLVVLDRVSVAAAL